MPEDIYMTNIAFRTMMEGVEEIVGKNGLKTILNVAGLSQYIDNLPPANLEKGTAKISDCSKYENAIREIFGDKGAKAILFSVGAAQAIAGIEENKELAEATLKAFEGMDNVERIRIVLSTAAAGVSEQIGSEIVVTEDGDDFLYEDKLCNHCFGIKTTESICHTASGFVYALVRWATRKGNYDVTQIKCTGMGDESCIVRVRLKG